MTKNSFVLQTRLKAVFAKLSDKQAGVLIKSIFEYADNGTVANFEDGMVGIVFEMVRQDIDYNAKKYAEICKRNAENGKLGGRPKQTLLEKPRGFLENPKKPNGYFGKHNDVDVDNDVDMIKQQRHTAQKSADSKPKPEKKLNDLQKFAVAVAERFEEPMDKVQLGIWYKRNCRCLTDILNFCGKSIPLGLETISVCVRRLEKAGLSGGYEAVARNLPEYLAQAKKQMEVINAGN